MIDKRYFVVKGKKDSAITYFEYDKMEGYDLSPKKNIKIKDAINVNKVVIINPSLMQKVASKKMDLKFKKLLEFMTIIFDNDDDDDTTSGEAYREGLNEISKLRLEAKVKYQKYMEEEEYQTLEKKLDILEQELNSRIYYLEQYYYQKQFESQYEEQEENSIGRRSR